jgi:hypothetical protein
LVVEVTWEGGPCNQIKINEIGPDLRTRALLWLRNVRIFIFLMPYDVRDKVQLQYQLFTAFDAISDNVNLEDLQAADNLSLVSDIDLVVHIY